MSGKDKVSIERNIIQWMSDFKEKLENISCRVKGSDNSLENGLKMSVDLLLGVKRSKRFVWWVANGGSTAISSHLSQDMINKLGIKSLSFNDVPLLTCMANDYGYPNVYIRPLEILSEKNDLLIAISSSGKSLNILNSLDSAIKRGLKTITFSGFKNDNPLWNRVSDVAFYLPYESYGVIEVAHEMILHSIIENMWQHINKMNSL